MLEHHGDAGQRRGDALAFDGDFAGRRRDQSVDATQQRGLAATGWADNGDDFGFADVEIDVAEHVELAVGLAEAAHADARVRYFRRRSGAAARDGFSQTHDSPHSLSLHLYATSPSCWSQYGTRTRAAMVTICITDRVAIRHHRVNPRRARRDMVNRFQDFRQFSLTELRIIKNTASGKVQHRTRRPRQFTN